MRKKFAIAVDCANCAAKVENALNAMPGLKAQVNFMTQKMTLEADAIDDALLASVEKTARKIEPEFEIKR
ncbi:MAG: heavy metal-associated domain-containing protein [Lachnospira sp.]|nr:heavy metal-associated domain-containing protein [Lachnospira sp.]